ncbi:hypothetical protein ACF8D3_15070 [Acinetobacter sp. YQ_14]|uniref:hypothetical protein n=1 Tax=Acinetobacter sp. YQ_14 TaxID=3367236 RepID=UPI00370C7365
MNKKHINKQKRSLPQPLRGLALLQEVMHQHKHVHLGNEIKSQIAQCSLDNIVEPIIKKSEFVLLIMNAPTEIVRLVEHQQAHGKTTYSLDFDPSIRLLVKNFQELILAKPCESITVGIECQAFDTALKKFKPKGLNRLAYREAGLSKFDYEGFMVITSMFNYLAKLIREYMNQPRIKRKIRDRDANCRTNKKRCIEVSKALFQNYSKVLVVRMDFALQRDIETLTKNMHDIDQYQSKNDLAYIKECLGKLLDMKSFNPLMKDVIGHIIRFEYTVRTGFHFHAYFMFDGNKHREDITIAQVIAQFWNERITKGLGVAHICNMKKSSYRYDGIGMIHYSDELKQQYLFRTFDYICKTDQFFIFLNKKGARRFQFSDLPEPKSNAGRPRKEINKQLPLFNDNNNMEQK